MRDDFGGSRGADEIFILHSLRQRKSSELHNLDKEERSSVGRR
jgi:hypothetical protein